MFKRALFRIFVIFNAIKECRFNLIEGLLRKNSTQLRENLTQLRETYVFLRERVIN